MSYRHLWRRVRADPERYGAERRKDGWYLPAGVDIERQRAAITWEKKARIGRALSEGKRPADVAREEEVSVRAVQEVNQHRREQREHMERVMKENPPELAGIHLRGGAYLKAVGPEELGEALAKFPPLGEGCCIDPLENVIYTSPERLREVAGYEDERKAGIEALHKEGPLPRLPDHFTGQL